LLYLQHYKYCSPGHQKIPFPNGTFEELRSVAQYLLKERIMQKGSLRQLYVDELKGLYSAETQLVKALPRMAKAASSAHLRQAFEEHLRQTAEQVSRLEEIFEALEEKPTGKKCLGMEGLIKETSETAQQKYDEATMDAALIGAAQRVEHYEIALYGTLRTFAQQLAQEDHVSLITQTLNEEKLTNESLTELAREINALSASTTPQLSDAGESRVPSGKNSRHAA
jgi:ferritin-like metal-binding protein YciE